MLRLLVIRQIASEIDNSAAFVLPSQAFEQGELADTARF
jgi:hypothetical protein